MSARGAGSSGAGVPPGAPPHAPRHGAAGHGAARAARRGAPGRGATVREAALLSALALELVSFALWDSDAARGLAVAAALGGLACVSAAAWSARPVIRLDRRSRALPWLGATVALVGVYGLALAVLRGNRPYYVAADAYHWFAELLLGTLLAAWALRSSGPRHLARIGAVGALALGALGLAIHALGSLGLAAGGGRAVEGLEVWRLELGRGFPEIPLIVVTAALFHRRRWPRGTRVLLWLACGLLLVDMGLALKRTMWLSYAAALVVIVAPRRTLAPGAAIALALGATAGIVAVLLPRETAALLSAAARTLTYNPDYTIQETLQERLLQYGGLVPYALRNPIGYGFGAEFRTFVPRLGDLAPVHYIHNLYLFYGLHVGLPGLAALGGAAIGFAVVLWRRLGVAPEWDWALRAGLAGLVAVGVNGLTLLSTHSLFVGLVLALGAVAARAVPARAGSRARVPTRARALPAAGRLAPGGVL